MDTKKRIKELMDERGWTIYELSKRSGLAHTTISNMWKRNTEPTIPSLRALCNGFGITLSQFFAEGDNGGTDAGAEGILYSLGGALCRPERDADESCQFHEIIFHNSTNKEKAGSTALIQCPPA